MAAEADRRDDRRLVRACLDGDATAWEALIRRYRRLVYSIPAAYRLSSDAADEVFQTVSLRLFEHLSRLERVESLPAWLMVTARRECQALSRSGRRWTALDDIDEGQLREDPVEVTARLDRIAGEHALARAFDKLGEPCHTLLRALYLEDPQPSYQEIGRRLARPIGSLGPTRARCLAKLRRLYVAAGGTEPPS